MQRLQAHQMELGKPATGDNARLPISLSLKLPGWSHAFLAVHEHAYIGLRSV